MYAEASVPRSTTAGFASQQKRVRETIWLAGTECSSCCLLSRLVQRLSFKKTGKKSNVSNVIL